MPPIEAKHEVNITARGNRESGATADETRLVNVASPRGLAQMSVFVVRVAA